MINKDLEKRLIKLKEVQSGKGVWQNKFHEFDVYNHTLKYVKHLKKMSSDPEMIVAGYLHDIGKPVVKRPKIKNGKREEKEPGKGYNKFDNHEKVGEEIVRNSFFKKLFERYKLKQERIAKLVGAHYLPMKGIKEMRKTTNYKDFLEKYHKMEDTLDKTGLSKENIMIMFLADCLSKGKGCEDIEELNLIRKSILTNGRNLREVYDLQKRMYKNKK